MAQHSPSVSQPTQADAEVLLSALRSQDSAPILGRSVQLPMPEMRSIYLTQEVVSKMAFEHGHNCPHCVALGVHPKSLTRHYICHKNPDDPLLVAHPSNVIWGEEPEDRYYEMRLAFWIQSSPDNWRETKHVLHKHSVHNWGVRRLEKKMGCRFGAWCATITAIFMQRDGQV